MPKNILYIMADQMQAGALPMHGGPSLVPNMERLASDGTVFDTAYCPSPICAPSRFSMMTGQLPHKVGAYDNSTEFPCSIPTFAHYLRNAGYRTCLSGKMHFVGPDQLHGFEERVTTDIYASDFTWAADWSQTDEVYSPSKMNPAGAIESGICARSMQLEYDEEVTYAARRRLFDYARGDRDQPFMMCVSYTHPHNPFIVTQKYWDRYEGVDIPAPDVPAISYADLDPWAQRYFRTIRQDEYDVTPEELMRARRCYYGMVSFVDDQIGVMLQTLAETGFDKDTIVIFASDHGEMLGERGSWYKFNPFEHSIRVPLIAHIPYVDQPKRESRAVSLMDLFPTFLDIAEPDTATDFAEPLDGQSLMPMLLGQDETRTDEVIVEYMAEGVYDPAIIMRRNGMKYVHCGDDPGLLFDLKNDPLELTNLASSAEYIKLAQEMRTEILTRWDLPTIREDVMRVQARRRVVQKSIHVGAGSPWDYTPPRDGTKEYVRPNPNIKSTTDIKRKARYPYVPPAVPQRPRKEEI